MVDVFDRDYNDEGDVVLDVVLKNKKGKGKPDEESDSLLDDCSGNSIDERRHGPRFA
jgi:hypothetical protein